MGAGLAATVILTACGASDPQTSDGSAGSPTTSSSFVSPLSEFLNPGSGSGDDGMAASMEKEKKVQELVAACMTEQGFDYEPFVYPMGPSSSPAGDLDYSSRAWAEKYGYGISTFDYAESSTTESAFVDPNQARVDAMSDGEREAYYAALWGGGMSVFGDTAGPGVVSSSIAASTAAAATTSPAASSAAAESPAASAVSEEAAPVSIPDETIAEPSMMPMADQGCTGSAQMEVYGDPNQQQTQFQGLFDAMNQMYTDIDGDPATKAALDAWIGCMADAGHAGYTEIYGANTEVNDKWSELNGWNTMSEGGMVSSGAGTALPSGPPAEKVSEFRAYEIALALADFDCKQSSGYAKVADDVRISQEEKFLAEHRAELEQYRDSLNGGG